MKQHGCNNYNNSSYFRMIKLVLKDRCKQLNISNNINDLGIGKYSEHTLERFFKMHEELILQHYKG